MAASSVTLPHKMCIRDRQMYVNADACRIVNNAKDEGKNICAVGTTVMRTIETAVGTDCLLYTSTFQKQGLSCLVPKRPIRHWRCFLPHSAMAGSLQE